MTRVSATLRVLEEATLRLFQCHLSTDWVSRGNSSYRHPLFFLLFYHIFLILCLPPHPIHHTEWPQAQTYHIAMEPAFSEKFFNWLALGLWYRCLLDCRMFCWINFLCGWWNSNLTSWCYKKKKSEVSILKAYPKAFLQVSFILNHKKIKDNFCWIQALSFMLRLFWKRGADTFTETSQGLPSRKLVWWR